MLLLLSVKIMTISLTRDNSGTQRGFSCRINIYYMDKHGQLIYLIKPVWNLANNLVQITKVPYIL